MLTRKASGSCILFPTNRRKGSLSPAAQRKKSCGPLDGTSGAKARRHTTGSTLLPDGSLPGASVDELQELRSEFGNTIGPSATVPEVAGPTSPWDEDADMDDKVNWLGRTMARIEQQLTNVHDHLTRQDKKLSELSRSGGPKGLSTNSGFAHKSLYS
eukprot:2669748-Prymnesium_polylepis.3